MICFPVSHNSAVFIPLTTHEVASINKLLHLKLKNRSAYLSEFENYVINSI